ncbi:glyoxalase [Sporosarcina highlanderae]|uniref:Glyoxalase n=1 Tax=Sporosarcina highlanderae TaxID=3035916 RepID=A0ABT8JWM6_9BACL|nr:glyoxalase [Sporosarcina highlanderae]MDN4608549.1 glyoxalase [Sporosarcina highlanderae]
MIKSATLYTNNVKALRRFYGNVLELDITDNAPEQFTVRIGESHLTFKHTDQPAFYHFAINIPGNQFSMMKYWITDRVTLNREEGRDEVYFPSFDADSMYFEDPAGNIVELIGRRKRDLFGDLTKESFLDISEISITTPHVVEVGDQLQDLGIPLRNGTEVSPNELNFLGRGDAFIVLVPPGRRWYFSKKNAETFPIEMTWNDEVIKLDGEGKLNS